MTSITSGGIPVAYGTLGQVIANSEQVRARLDLLTRQVGSGKISDSYAGLGAGAGTSLSVTASVAHTRAWQANIDASAGRMQVAQTALSQVSQIASTFYAQTNSLNGLNPASVDNIAASARDALKQVAGLLDSRDGDTYVFAGQDAANPPVPNADAILTSGFVTQITAAIVGLQANGAAATIATTLAVATSNAAGVSPFSAALSQPAASLTGLRSTADVGDGQRVPTGILASANADVASTGPSTTGSYIRDVLRSLATIGALTSAQSGVAGFAAIAADTRSSLGGAISALNGDAGALGNRQAQLQTSRTQLGDTVVALQSQLSSAEDVDMATTLSNMTATQTRLQASYQIIAAFQSLTLTKYLGG